MEAMMILSLKVPLVSAPLRESTPKSAMLRYSFRFSFSFTCSLICKSSSLMDTLKRGPPFPPSVPFPVSDGLSIYQNSPRTPSKITTTISSTTRSAIFPFCFVFLLVAGFPAVLPEDFLVTYSSCLLSPRAISKSPFPLSLLNRHFY